MSYIVSEGYQSTTIHVAGQTQGVIQKISKALYVVAIGAFFGFMIGYSLTH